MCRYCAQLYHDSFVEVVAGITCDGLYIKAQLSSGWGDGWGEGNHERPGVRLGIVLLQ